MATCLIGLGSNLGDRRRTLDQAIGRLQDHPRVRVVAQSRWRETLPAGGPPGQGPFLNGAAVLETSLGAEALFAVLSRIESDLGRRRRQRWGPRRVDLDLLLYDDTVLQTAALTIPHPRMAWRRFVLEPAAEVAGSMVHPTTGWTIARLLEHLDTALPYVAIAGPIAVGKTSLARRLARETGATPIAERIARSRLAAFYADPPGNAWATEIEFLWERASLLRADSPRWTEPGRLWVSDFWFNQGLAFARVWLPPDRRGIYRTEWEAARRTVAEPRLTVVLDAPAGLLRERIRRRGRPGERDLSLDQLERIRRAILTEASRLGQGPVLRLSGADPALALEEVSAAVAAMR